jgi:hypothetical protein
MKGKANMSTELASMTKSIKGAGGALDGGGVGELGQCFDRDVRVVDAKVTKRRRQGGRMSRVAEGRAALYYYTGRSRSE